MIPSVNDILLTRGVISADWHLRSTVPQCAGETKEEWMKVQKEAVQKVVDICLENNCDLFVVGDLYHKVDDISFECVSIVQNAAIELSKKGLKFYFLAGNHDLPFHSSANIYKSAIGVLLNSYNCYLLKDGVFTNATASNFDEPLGDNEIVFRHVLVVPEKDKMPWLECRTPTTLREEYNKAKFIFTGDYHKSFVSKVPGKATVVNPGCLTVQVVDMIDYENGCYLWEGDDIVWKPIEVQRKFLELKSVVKKDESIDTFVSAVKDSSSVSLDYVSNLEKRLEMESEEIKETVRSWL